MENMRHTPESGSKSLSARNRKFGDRVIRSVLEDGVTDVVVNPMFFGLAYRDEAVYPYIQAELAAKGIKTHIAEDLIESGSEAKIPRHTLIVDSRPEN
jgi:hypothetical protein